MGSVGDFIFGGSGQKSTGSNASQYTNQSNSTSNQNSANVSQSSQVSGNQSQNQAYGPLSAGLMSTVGYVPAAGNMMAALLGLPQSTFNYNQPVGIRQPVLPSNPGTNLGHLIDVLKTVNPTPTPAPTPSPNPNPNPTPNPTPGFPGPIPGSGSGGGAFGGPSVAIKPQYPAGGLGDITYIKKRENGGPVQAGQPYLVGEKRPEVFVPHTSGTIVPQVPQGFATALPSTQNQYSGATPYNPSVGSPSDALNTFANSAGMNFMLDQGQKALSGASAANGVFNSGATGQALTQFGQNLGKTYLNDYMNHQIGRAHV